MPYKDKNKQREYARVWMEKRRQEFFRDKYCVKCRSTQNLELDHINPNEKVSHKIWGWSEERRTKELAKCQVLCHKHHLEKTAEENRIRGSVPNLKQRKLTDDEVLFIRNSIGKLSDRDLAKLYKVGKTTINYIRNRNTYKDYTLSHSSPIAEATVLETV